MRIVRFQHPALGESTWYGRLEEESIRVIPDPWSHGEAGKEQYARAEVRLLAPVRPGKVICVGLNYRDHAEEVGLELPGEPVLFMKPATSVIGPEANIVMPAVSRRVDYEAELAVVVGRTLRRAGLGECARGVLGYTCGNDVTARDLQKKDGQWTRAKSFDTFCPLGPWIETGADPADLEVILRQNGEIRQRSRTSHLIFSIPELLSFVSGVMTLEPGDVLLTGTPSGIGPMAPGDRIEVEVEGVGTLVNLAAGEA